MLSIETVTHQCSEKCYRSVFGVPTQLLTWRCAARQNLDLTDMDWNKESGDNG